MEPRYIEKSKPKFTDRPGDELREVLAKEAKAKPSPKENEEKEFIDQLKGGKK